ncbi:MAG: sugar phosphate isomerase/epimerase [Lachnospiraceae bacterium]|jgi:sugar phosphate isomerase/epimerase|nr:sugar phosphate isomerase/epimerase [Lachnospiraceae bacterium]
MHNIHISTIVGNDLPVEEQLPMIQKAGFDGFFTLYTGTGPLKAWASLAKEWKLDFETIHGPFQYANRMWEPGTAGDDYLDFLKRCIDACHLIQVDKFILHTTVGNHAPDVSQKGLSRFQKLCDYAKALGVHICFENIEPLPHLKAVMDYITDPFHGFCWDIGHNICYTPHIDMMELYGNRLMCLHIHDNRGVTQPGNIDYRDDLHLLPFDGVLDWDWFAEKLNEYHYDGPVTLEVSDQNLSEYHTMSTEAYLAIAYERGCRLRDKLYK